MSEEPISLFDIDSLHEFFKSIQLPNRQIQKIRRKLFKDLDFKSEIDLVEHASTFDHKVKQKYLTVKHRLDSKLDVSSKILFETEDGYSIETVVMRYKKGRTTVCVSTQVGCSEKCRFCATSKIGLKRNLTYFEICDQIYQCSKLLKSESMKLNNIVFMGMGEPLRNYKELEKALSVLFDGKAFNIMPKHVTVSTLGLVPEMKRFAKQYPKVNMALSLNASNNEDRNDLMPINLKFSMQDLKKICLEIEKVRNAPMMIEYILFGNKNNSSEDCDQLMAFLNGLNVHVNLIPFNDHDLSLGLKPSLEEDVKNFKDKLLEAGYKVTRRYSMGQDIAAACGQLANKQ